MENEKGVLREMIYGENRLYFRVAVPTLILSAALLLGVGIRSAIDYQHERNLRKESERKWLLEKYDSNRDGVLNENEIQKLVDENYISNPGRKNWGR